MYPYTPSTPWNESQPHPVFPAKQFSSTHACLSPSSITTRTHTKNLQFSRNKQKQTNNIEKPAKDSNLGQKLSLTRDVLSRRRTGRTIFLLDGERIFGFALRRRRSFRGGGGGSHGDRRLDLRGLRRRGHGYGGGGRGIRGVALEAIVVGRWI